MAFDLSAFTNLFGGASDPSSAGGAAGAGGDSSGLNWSNVGAGLAGTGLGIYGTASQAMQNQQLMNWLKQQQAISTGRAGQFNQTFAGGPQAFMPALTDEQSRIMTNSIKANEAAQGLPMGARTSAVTQADLMKQIMAQYIVPTQQMAAGAYTGTLGAAANQPTPAASWMMSKPQYPVGGLNSIPALLTALGLGKRTPTPSVSTTGVGGAGFAGLPGAGGGVEGGLGNITNLTAPTDIYPGGGYGLPGGNWGEPVANMGAAATAAPAATDIAEGAFPSFMSNW